MVGDQTLRLARLDPATLRALPGMRVPVGDGGCASREGGTACWSVPPWSFSPNRARLAVARDGRSLRIVDVSRMRVAADIRPDGGSLGALAWLAPDKLLVIQEAGNERQRLLEIDVAKRKVASRRKLGGSVLRLAGTPRELVMLVAPANAIGPAQLAVADRNGNVRFVRLGSILAGSKLLIRSGHAVERRLPGLAVDPEARQAFVIDRTTVAAVDLRTLAVTFHDVREAPPSSRRLGRSPAASTKVVRGYSRSARWLGAGLVAISGTEESEQAGMRPAGLLLLDTRNWSTRTVDAVATSFVVAGDLLLVTEWSPAQPGLTAYGFDGGRRFQLLFDGLGAWVAQVYGARAYVGVARPDPRSNQFLVVDLSAGRVIEERRQSPPWLLLDTASGWWD